MADDRNTLEGARPGGDLDRRRRRPTIAFILPGATVRDRALACLGAVVGIALAG
ncbi:MAG TPA: hypothetical protein VH268_10705 [Solirubrobacterales bacterium]|nr:hypothetical protein [Solirubrobacterales bacterium]